MERKFKDRFTWIEGDSLVQVPLYASSHPDEKFDLIFIDGGHSFECCFYDIYNCRLLAHKDTIVWIDDYGSEVKIAVDTCVNNQLITLLDFKSAEDEPRAWVIARYNLGRYTLRE